jgi:hypothetical protein
MDAEPASLTPVGPVDVCLWQCSTVPFSPSRWRHPLQRCLWPPAMRGGPMRPVRSALHALLTTLRRSRLALQHALVALRRQEAVSQQAVSRPRRPAADRLWWAWLAWRWPGWRAALPCGQPRPGIAWQHKRCCAHGRQRSQSGTRHGSQDLMPGLSRKSTSSRTKGRSKQGAPAPFPCASCASLAHNASRIRSAAL